MVMFWAFRAIVTLMAELHQDFGGIVPLNKTLEIILLFLVLVCIVLVVKRKMVGALMYLLSYGIYFGTDILKNINTIIEMEGTITSNNIYEFICIIYRINITNCSIIRYASR